MKNGVMVLSYLVISIFVVPEKEPSWRLKVCPLQTPTEHLIGFSSYRHKLITDDYRQYRCY